MTVTCKVCRQPMKPEHGIVNFTDATGTTWWQCVCGRRVRERYAIQGLKIITVEATEV